MSELIVTLIWLGCQVAAVFTGDDDCRVMLRIDSEQTTRLGDVDICYRRDVELWFRERVVLSTDPRPCRRQR